MAVPRTNLEAAASQALRHGRTRSMPQEPQGRAGLLLPALPSFGKQKPLEIQVLVLRLLPASAKLTCTKRHKKQLSPQTSPSLIAVMYCCGASRDREPSLFSTAPHSHRTY